MSAAVRKADGCQDGRSRSKTETLIRPPYVWEARLDTRITSKGMWRVPDGDEQISTALTLTLWIFLFMLFALSSNTIRIQDFSKTLAGVRHVLEDGVSFRLHNGTGKELAQVLQPSVLGGRRFDLGLGEECESIAASSVRCVEARLFLHWQATTERSEEELLERPPETMAYAKAEADADAENVSSSLAQPFVKSGFILSSDRAAPSDAEEAEDVDPAPNISAEVASEAAAVAEDGPLLSDEILQARQLHWNDVATWSSAATITQLRGFRPAILVAHASDMGNSRWTGRKPRVACIAMVTSGPNAVSQLKELVRSFKAQDYDGPKQLVLVHHRDDKTAQKLAARYVDRSPGAPVKAVAAVLKVDEPATVAYRYGAWSVQADVIARYDMEAWHHPSRLSMQTKALALAKRPVSRLPSIKAPREAGETSLVGEKAWMERNWQPLHIDESKILLQDSTVHIVHVDIPDLLAY